MRTTAMLLTVLLLSSLPVHADSWNGEEYSKNSLSQQMAADRLLKKHQVSSDSTLLDVGCGDGKITAALAKQLKGEVVGLDISRSMIEHAQRNFSSTKNLSFVVEDAEKLSYQRRFNYVTSFNALQWVKDQPRALKGMYNALKPKGSVLISMPKHYPECLSNAILDLAFQAPYNTRFSNFESGQVFFGVDEYKKLLENAGFVDVHVAKVDGRDQFKDLASFQAFVKQWLPWARVFDNETEKDLFMSKLMERYVAYCPRGPDGSVVFLKHQLEASAARPAERDEL